MTALLFPERANPYRGHRPTQLQDLIDASGDCWLWLGNLRSGYGRLNWQGSKATAHRLVWELLVGPIPDGMTIDHLCRVRSCVNPDHLEVVTLAENIRRGLARHKAPIRQGCRTHGMRDVFTRPNGHRVCRICRRRNNSAWKARRRGIPR